MNYVEYFAERRARTTTQKFAMWKKNFVHVRTQHKSCIIALGFASGNNVRFGLHSRDTATSYRAIVSTIDRYTMQYSYIVYMAYDLQHTHTHTC